MPASSGRNHCRFSALANRLGCDRVGRRAGQRLASPPPPACILGNPMRLPGNDLVRLGLILLACALLAWLVLPLITPELAGNTPPHPAKQAMSAGDRGTLRAVSSPSPSAQRARAGAAVALPADADQMPFASPRYRNSGPGKIRCGDLDCTTSGQLCCHVEHDKFCVDAKDGCPDAGWDIACDETADCEAGLKCCGEPVAMGRRQARCADSCSRDTRQLCAHDDECESRECVLGSRCERVVRGRLKLPAKR